MSISGPSDPLARGIRWGCADEGKFLGHWKTSTLQWSIFVWISSPSSLVVASHHADGLQIEQLKAFAKVGIFRRGMVFLSAILRCLQCCHYRSWVGWSFAVCDVIEHLLLIFCASK